MLSHPIPLRRPLQLILEQSSILQQFNSFSPNMGFMIKWERNDYPHSNQGN